MSDQMKDDNDWCSICFYI